MWIMHADEVHFDLLVRKDSELAREGTVDDMEIDNKNEDEKVEEDFKEKIAELKDGYDEMKKS